MVTEAWVSAAFKDESSGFLDFALGSAKQQPKLHTNSETAL